MKKLIAALTLLLAFSINANAQTKKTAVANVATNVANKDVKTPTANELAKKDATDLTAFLKLTPTETDNFTRLFELKYTTLQDKTLSDERKLSLSRAVEAKLRASLNAEQTDKLEKNKALFTRLIN